MAPGQAQLSEAVAPYTLAFISRNYDSENNTTNRFLKQVMGPFLLPRG
jgi:hypothetical protein